MIINNINNLIKEKIVVALGFFDCVHIGHRKLLESCKKLAARLGAKIAVFTFDNNAQRFFSNKTKCQIYDFEERCSIFSNIGLDYVLYASVDKNFCQKSPLTFLQDLFMHNIVGVVCGYDYSFGNKAQGSVKMLEKFCSEKSIPFVEVPMVAYLDNKVSTTLVGQMLTAGQIQQANALLGDFYRYTGIVSDGYKIGRTIGFPTANIALTGDKILPKEGVYAGFCDIDSNRYKAIINIGCRPTYFDSDKKIEVHLIQFDGDLYGKKITIYFDRFLRPQKQFESQTQLIAQLKSDVAEVIQ